VALWHVIDGTSLGQAAAEREEPAGERPGGMDGAALGAQQVARGQATAVVRAFGAQAGAAVAGQAVAGLARGQADGAG